MMSSATAVFQDQAIIIASMNAELVSAKKSQSYHLENPGYISLVLPKSVQTMYDSLLVQMYEYFISGLEKRIDITLMIEKMTIMSKTSEVKANQAYSEALVTAIFKMKFASGIY